jgi:uncharacterized membrane protein YhaH (DUF805 family)
MNVGNYLFGFNGRINRAKWWIFALIAIVYTVIIQYVVMRNIAVTFIIYLLLQVPLWYVAVAVNIKRLHDRNKGAIWALLFPGIPIVISAYTTYLSWGAYAAVSAMSQATTQEEMQAAATAAQEAAQGMMAGMGSMYWVLLIIELVAVVWAIVELGCLKGTTGDNQYGPDPLAGK